MVIYNSILIIWWEFYIENRKVSGYLVGRRYNPQRYSSFLKPATLRIGRDGKISALTRHFINLTLTCYGSPQILQRAPKLYPKGLGNQPEDRDNLHDCVVDSLYSILQFKLLSTFLECGWSC